MRVVSRLIDTILPTDHRPVTEPSSLVGMRCNDGARAVALHDMTEHAMVGLRRLATLLRGRFSAGVGPVYKHACSPLIPVLEPTDNALRAR